MLESLTGFVVVGVAILVGWILGRIDLLGEHARAVLARCAADDKPCVLVLARPYHMDPGIGHEIEVDLQAHGYAVLWTQ